MTKKLRVIGIAVSLFIIAFILIAAVVAPNGNEYNRARHPERYSYSTSVITETTTTTISTISCPNLNINN